MSVSSHHGSAQPCQSCGLPPSDLAMAPDAWAEHPRYPRQTLLLGSHRNFRNISARLVDDARQLVAGGEQDAAEVTATRWLFEAWMGAMSGHEHYEEHKLYRYLAHRFGGSFVCLEDEHHALHAARDRVRSAYEQADAGELYAALEEHRRVLLDHLAHEEEVVIPLLLQLEPDEFDRYYHSPIAWLLASAAKAADAAPEGSS